MEKLISFDKIDLQTKILAKNISDEHRGSLTPVVIVGLLNGCYMFYSDLTRAVSINIECDFMRVKSYIGKRKQGDVQITKDLETPIKGKHVYIIDDIYDTGNTMNVVMDYLKVKQPASMSAVTLIKRTYSPTPSYPLSTAFTIDNEWIVGYGLDDEKGNHRNLHSIYSL